jgi:hypothetical protein
VQTNSGCARATTNGFVDELWTLDRIALLIQRLTGISHHPAHVWALLRHRLGWTMRCPVRRATERDQAMVDQWVAERRPRIKQTPNAAKPVLVGTVASGPKAPPRDSKVEALPVRTAGRSAQSDQS